MPTAKTYDGLHCTVLYLRATVRQARSRIHERTISLKYLGIILRVLRLEASMFTLETSFKPLVAVTVDSTEKNCCPKYVQELGLGS
jgi:hypothetical protein